MDRIHSVSLKGYEIIQALGYQGWHGNIFWYQALESEGEQVTLRYQGRHRDVSRYQVL